MWFLGLALAGLVGFVVGLIVGVGACALGDYLDEQDWSSDLGD